MIFGRKKSFKGLNYKNIKIVSSDSHGVLMSEGVFLKTKFVGFFYTNGLNLLASWAATTKFNY